MGKLLPTRSSDMLQRAALATSKALLRQSATRSSPRIASSTRSLSYKGRQGLSGPAPVILILQFMTLPALPILWYLKGHEEQLKDAGLSNDGGPREDARADTAHMGTFSQRMPRIILYKLGVPKEYLRGYEDVDDEHLPPRWVNRAPTSKFC